MFTFIVKQTNKKKHNSNDSTVIDVIFRIFLGVLY